VLIINKEKQKIKNQSKFVITIVEASAHAAMPQNKSEPCSTAQQKHFHQLHHKSTSIFCDFFFPDLNGMTVQPGGRMQILLRADAAGAPEVLAGADAGMIAAYRSTPART
jgi:hypothetical protein